MSFYVSNDKVYAFLEKIGPDTGDSEHPKVENFSSESDPRLKSVTLVGLLTNHLGMWWVCVTWQTSSSAIQLKLQAL